MRISDWSSDVCSSDLAAPVAEPRDHVVDRFHESVPVAGSVAGPAGIRHQHLAPSLPSAGSMCFADGGSFVKPFGRSEERRGGKECVSTCRYRWAQYHEKKKKMIKALIQYNRKK